MIAERQVVNYPEPEIRPLKEEEVMRWRDRFVDPATWELVQRYWGVTFEYKPLPEWARDDDRSTYEVSHIGRPLEFQFFNTRTIRAARKAQTAEQSGAGGAE